MKQHKLCRLEKEIRGVKMVVTQKRAGRVVKEADRGLSEALRS